VIENTLKRSVTMSSVHTSLYRLEEIGFVKSTIGGATNERGGRRKRFYSITDTGKSVLLEAKLSRTKLWSLIPEVIFNK
jgi:DNA-binding PadR family transcriptional regulator